MTSRPRSTHRRTEYAWLITGPLALCAVLVCLLLGLTADPALGRLPVTLLLTVAMAAAAVPTINVVIRRQAFLVFPTEIPLVVALFALPPLSVVLAYTVASFVIQLRRKLLPVKLWFNVAGAAAATSLATLVYTVLREKPGDVGPGTWGVLLAAISVHAVVQLAAMAGVFTVVQSWQAGRELIRAGGPPMLLGVVINLSIGLLIIISLDSTPWAILIFAGLAVAFALVYHSYAQFLRQHRTLSEMYELTKAITESGSDGNLIDALLVRIRSLMQAESATLWVPAQGRHPEVLLTAQEGKPGLLDSTPTPAALREAALVRQETVAVSHRLGGDSALREVLEPTKVKDVIVVPLRSGKAVIGTLEVANRLGDTNSFGTRGRHGLRDRGGARRGGAGEFPPGRPAAARRVPRRPHQAAQPAADPRCAGRGGPDPRPGRGGRAAALRRRPAASGQRVPRARGGGQGPGRGRRPAAWLRTIGRAGRPGRR